MMDEGTFDGPMPLCLDEDEPTTQIELIKLDALIELLNACRSAINSPRFLESREDLFHALTAVIHSLNRSEFLEVNVLKLLDVATRLDPSFVARWPTKAPPR